MKKIKILVALLFATQLVFSQNDTIKFAKNDDPAFLEKVKKTDAMTHAMQIAADAGIALSNPTVYMITKRCPCIIKTKPPIILNKNIPNCGVVFDFNQGGISGQLSFSAKAENLNEGSVVWSFKGIMPKDFAKGKPNVGSNAKGILCDSWSSWSNVGSPNCQFSFLCPVIHQGLVQKMVQTRKCKWGTENRYTYVLVQCKLCN